MKYTFRFLLLMMFLGNLSCEEWELPKEDFIQVRLIQATASGLTSAAAEAEALDLTIGQITAHGFVWSASDPSPTININEGREDLGLKNPGDPPGFSASFDNLLPNTRYFIRAYAQVKEEVIYSKASEIQTGTGMVITEDFVYESGTSLLISGRISGVEAGIIAINHGFCWSTSNALPTIDDSFFELGNQRTGALFTHRIDSLINDTPYYLRAYAILNINGALQTVYGEVLTFDGNLKDVWVYQSEVPLPNTNFTASFVLGNKAYFYASSFLEYDPQTDQWTEKSGLPAEVGGAWSGFAVGDRGYVYAVTNDNIFSSECCPSPWRYHPEDDTWTQEAFHHEYPRQGMLMVGTMDKGYFGFGSTIMSSFGDYSLPGWWEFDPSQNCDTIEVALPGCWTKKNHPPELTRSDPKGFAIGQKIYVGLGANVPSGIYKLITSLQDWWEFDTTTDTWTPKSTFIGDLGSDLTAISAGGKGYVYCRNNTFWEYDPENDSWQEKAGLPILEDFIKAESFSINGIVYLMTSVQEGETKLWSYDSE